MQKFIEEETGKELESSSMYGIEETAGLNKGDFVELYDDRDEKTYEVKSKTLTTHGFFKFIVSLVSIFIIVIFSVTGLKADELKQEPTAKQVKTAKQKKLEVEIEALVSTPLSNEEILGKDFIEYVNNKHKGGK